MVSNNVFTILGVIVAYEGSRITADCNVCVYASGPVHRTIHLNNFFFYRTNIMHMLRNREK